MLSSGFSQIIESSISSSEATPEKLQNWLKKGKSADLVFKRLQLDKAGQRVFHNPQFATWVQYADDLSVKTPEMSAISSLTRQYGDDVLFEMIQTAKTNPRTKGLAIKMETSSSTNTLTTSLRCSQL
ncbi:Avirulence (Avh) protein [Phytophthora megakarya]|uniref:Avirulence (Avh) protein n=1 Tax=Phytophthora megakarya TaxID=4795 RepID=A0A225VVD9_9STRA|nr:Avirulence (Avh) protein [Phytophthora megakarya]